MPWAFRAAAAALVLLVRGAFAAEPPPAVDRLLKPQKAVIEVFHEPGVPRLEVERVIDGRPVSLASLFAPGGIQLEFVFRDGALPSPLPRDFLQLMQVVQRLQTPPDGAVWRAAIVVADDNDDGILSTAEIESHRTAVIYVKPNRGFGGDASLGMFYGAAHELTHILNLHHADWEGRSFTRDSTIESYSGPETVRWRLSEASVTHLRHAPDAFVRPGGVPFGVVLAEHAARHQRTPDEQYDVVNSPDEVEPRPGAPVRVIPPLSRGPIVLIRSELTAQQATTRDAVSVFLAVEARESHLKEILVDVSGAGGRRELRHLRTPDPERQDLDLSVPLDLGINRVSASALDKEGYRTQRELTLVRQDIPGKLLAVVFGVQQYENVRPLKHTLSDARGVRDLLLGLGLEKDRLFYRENPDLTTVRTGLGTWLRQQAGPKDVAVVYFAGHGAAEIDPDSEEPDKLSKYLLPAEAHLANLYATALPMSEIADLLRRIKARTLLVILDTCFSGSAGGRAVAAESNRATSVLAQNFLGRGAGEGRVILSASGANEAAQEADDLGHGLFTFYLLAGLSGKADTQPDGQVDLLELAGWVSQQVRDRTGGKQKPGIWGEVRDAPVLWRRAP